MCACAWEPNTTVKQYNTMMTAISVKGRDGNKQVIEREGRLTLGLGLERADSPFATHYKAQYFVVNSC